jgi:molecular chaperone GrpE
VSKQPKKHQKTDTESEKPPETSEETSEIGPQELKDIDSPKAHAELLSREELEAALILAQQQVEDYKTKLAYLQAEHQNYQKAVEKREKHLIDQANRNLILQLLPVLDDLERAELLVPRIPENQPFIDGLQMVINGFKEALKKAGVQAIDAEGKEFDPLRHEIIIRDETTAHKPKTIIEELRRGYLLKGELLRPTMVKVAVVPPKKVKKSKTEKK